MNESTDRSSSHLLPVHPAAFPFVSGPTRARALLLLLLLCQAPLAAAASAPEEEARAWREGRDEKLRKPDGWVSLIGLHWLREGEQRLGSGEDNDLVLATGPAHLGTLTLSSGQVHFCPSADGVSLEDLPDDGSAGEAMSRGFEAPPCVRLATDAEARASRVRFGSAQFYVIDREGALALRVKDSEAPTLLAFEGMEYFPFDPSWRVEATFEPHEAGRIMEIPNILGSVERTANPGRLLFERDGSRYALEAVRYDGEDELFVIFADRTNGKSTYGAGRFLYTPLPNEDNRVVMDFNQSYNPPCVFTPYATCPLPPPGNRLRVFVEAGEKRYAQEAH